MPQHLFLPFVPGGLIPAADSVLRPLRMLPGLLTLCLAAGLLAGRTLAQDELEDPAPPSGLLVQGEATTRALPDSVLILLWAKSNAPVSEEAIAKYRDELEGVHTRLKGLAIPGLEVRDGGVRVRVAPDPLQAAALTYGSSEMVGELSPVVEIRGEVWAELQIAKPAPDDLLNTVGRILDESKSDVENVNMTALSGNPALVLAAASKGYQVLFVLNEETAEQTRQQAYEQAFGKARARAEFLARLAGRELGEVLSIEEVSGNAKADKKPGRPAPSDGAFSAAMENLSAMLPTASTPGQLPEGPQADNYSLIPVKVQLLVRFALKELKE